MLSELRKRVRKSGTAPGTVTYTGEHRTERPRISVVDFDADNLLEEELDPERVAQCAEYRTTESVSWIDLQGLHDVHLLETLGTAFGIHPLVLEDIAHPGQRAKLEVHEDSLFIVVRAITPGPNDLPEEEQISLIVGPNYLLSFRERPGPVFDAVRQRIQASRGRVRGMGVDYLAYVLLDAVVDQYFMVLEDIGEALEDLEDLLLDDPGPECLEALHEVRKPVMAIRRATWPIRDLLNVLLRGESTVFRTATLPFLRDLQDHTLQVVDIVEDFRDLQTSLMELYLSSSSQRTNEVMKVLTVIATVFIPLTFLAGVYGMNFEFMPELHWRWAYPLFWIGMGVITAGQVYFIWRKKWF